MGLIESARSADRRQARERHGELRGVVLLVVETALEEIDVGLHVEVAVATEIEQDAARLAVLPAAQGLVDGALDGMIGLRRRHDALGAGEGDAGLEALELPVGARFDQLELLQVGVRLYNGV